MKTLLTIAATLLILGLLVAGFVWSGTYNIGADDPHTRPVYALLEMLRERSIESHSVGISVPDLKSAELIRSGAGNYDAMCTGCHLAPGLNDTEISKGLYPSPPNFSKEAIDDPAEAFWAIKHGIKTSGMPAWGKSMQDQYIWGLVAFVRELPKLNSESYEEAVATSGGHSHGGGESAGHTHGDEHEHEGGADHHDADESQPQGAMHTHADGTRHVYAADSAVATAAAFQDALNSSDAAQVKALLDPKVLIFESGAAERSRAEYAARHLKADMDFLKTVTYKLQRQTGDVVGDLAWVASESRLRGASTDKAVDVLGTETLVLKKGTAGWRVVHVHWSAHPVGE
jgi:ketosteroid isomerase-like protein/mono/diheme cytochrome c family protein